MRQRFASLFRRLGQALDAAPPVPSLSPYEYCLSVLAATKPVVSIVIVGANDGRVNDPVYAFCQSRSAQTRVVAVEPQADVVPFLRENYSFHPAFTALHGAVGAGGSLTLYAVRSEAWPLLVVPYARDWPVYRAATGVTSANRDHVRRWLAKHAGPKLVDLDEAIKPLVIQCTDLRTLLSANGIPAEVDVLQVDAEGEDDTVIYSSNVETLRPSIIYFERKCLSAERYAKLAAYLGGLGYSLSHVRHDSLAIRNAPE